MKIVVLGGIPESLTIFRGPLIARMVQQGHQVIAMAGSENPRITDELAGLGAIFEAYPLARTGSGIVADLKTLLALRRSFARHQPDAVFAYTVKPVIWGGLAARFAGIPAFHALVTGLGNQFDAGSARRRWLGRLIESLYRSALSSASTVIFQNEDDRAQMVGRGIVPATLTHRVNGSGLDLDFYPVSVVPDGAPVFLTVARLLPAKGLRELAEAARILLTRRPELRFVLVGREELGAGAITRQEVGVWEAAGIFTYLPSVPDARSVMAYCHVYVLPSYYGEGVPRTILEAMATGRPVLSTDNVGCRDAVVEDETGHLVASRSVEALVAGLEWMLANRARWGELGAAGRRRAEAVYDVHKVNAELMRIMNTGS